jgi:hypothetical protein
MREEMEVIKKIANRLDCINIVLTFILSGVWAAVGLLFVLVSKI